MHVVRHAVRQDLRRDPVAVEREVLRALRARSRDDLPRVRREARARHARVAVHRGDATVRTRHEHLHRQQLLDAQDDTILAPHPEREPAVVHRFARVVHLKHLSIRRVCGGGQVVPRADAGHHELRCGGSSRRVVGLRDLRGSTLNLDPSGTRDRRRPRSLEPRAEAGRARTCAVRRERVWERATGSTRERYCAPIAWAF